MDQLNGDDIGRLVYLGLLGAVIVGSYLAHTRLEAAKSLQQALIWVLIFVGFIAGYGLWNDMKYSNSSSAVMTDSGVISVPKGRDGHYHVKAEVNGREISFLVDTGASQIVLTQMDARRAGLEPASLDFNSTAGTANGVVSTAPVVLDSLKVSEIEDKRVRAYVNGGELDVSLLGMDYLDRFSRVEFRNDRMYLTR